MTWFLRTTESWLRVLKVHATELHANASSWSWSEQAAGCQTMPMHEMVIAAWVDCMHGMRKATHPPR